MTISSPAFENYQMIPQKYTCQGEGVHPPLTIADVPSDAKSLALIVDDPDAPTGLFTHWIIWDIPADATSIDEGEVPGGAVQGKNSAGQIGWIAPCPPSDTGVHHYRFQLFALSQALTMPEGVSRAEIEEVIERYDIDRAELVGKYTTEAQHKNPTELV